VALRIAHLSFSRTGGAGGVASRLAEIQQAMGHDAQVISAISGSLRDSPLSHPLHTLAAVSDERLIKNSQFSAPISLLRDRLSSELESAVDPSDVIHIHWPNGFIDLEWLASRTRNKTVVWTLHDMNAFTGACHYSLGCDGFKRGCESCPAVKGFAHNTARNHLSKKSSVLSQFANIHLVSPSHWLAQQAKTSSALSSHDVTVIPNPLSGHMPVSQDQTEARTTLGLANGKKVVFALSASHLDDPVKAARLGIEAFRKAFSGRDDALLLVMGRGSVDSSETIRHFGYVSADTGRSILAAADFLLVPSRAENQPLVISEAQSLGTSVIVRNDTGLPEHLGIDPSGKTFDRDDDLPGILREAAQTIPSTSERATLAERAAEKFDPKRIAQAYEEIYLSS
jgi:glycosyltransferase involved in cell wall biosynthesis